MNVLKRMIRDRIELKDSSSIIQKIKGYKYVSFDVFDTLLKRNLVTPEDLFKVLGMAINDTSFYEKRVSAEAKARELKNREEINLDDIYNCLDKKYNYCKNLELDLEYKYNVQNLWLVPIVKYCYEKGIKIIAISDMYLSGEFIGKMLSHANIPVEHLFVSSDYNKSKGTGELFKLALKELGLESKELIHIGDTFSSDYQGAKKAGLSAILIPRKLSRCQFYNLDQPEQNTFLNQFINNTINIEKSFYYQVGYSCFGPAMYGLVQWLHKKAAGKRIFFFARDGYVVKQIYNQLYPKDPTEYLYLSRRSLSVPLLWKHSKWGDFFLICQ